MASISPVEMLCKLGLQHDKSEDFLLSDSFAELMDKNDSLAKYRDEFEMPTVHNLPYETEDSSSAIYFLGHSTGLKPKRVDEDAKHFFDKWGKLASLSWFHGDVPFALSDRPGKAQLVDLIGAADVSEIAIMNALTVNLQLLLIAFYKPNGNRNKILIEHNAFSSDRYCAQSLLKLHNIEDGLITVMPRDGEDVINDEDVIDIIKQEGEDIALVLLSGVSYYTGQKFDMKGITMQAKKHGCNIGWDLAHAIGNVELKLNEWGVDFAVWCSYKYLISGPGGIGGAFVHSSHHENMPSHIDGWFGNKWETLLEMRENIDYIKGADEFRLSRPSALLCIIQNTGLKIFENAGMDAILQKQFLITGYLEHLLKSHLSSKMKILTPAEPQRRGSMLSIQFVKCDLQDLHNKLKRKGVMCDMRKPNVIRVTPIPFYNTFMDVYKFVKILDDILHDN